MSKALAEFGGLVLFEQMKKFTEQQEKTMAAIEDLRAVLTAQTAKIAEIGTAMADNSAAQTAAFAEVAADFANLKAQIAAGSVTQADVDKAQASLQGLEATLTTMKGNTEALRGLNPDPNFPAPPTPPAA